ncbi:MAG: NAD-binding protein [Planctomycetes bacterium]|nr:NAD-binding protein [Planctomycetota bacterium]
MNPFDHFSANATYRDGAVHLDDSVDWPDGARLEVIPVLCGDSGDLSGPVIIAGFGLAGRCVADLLDQVGISYTVIERNAVTVETQAALGRSIIEGDTTDRETLLRAGLQSAAGLALTIPDEDAVLKATFLARQLNPDVFIIARTNYSSKGMRAAQLGADEVIKAELAVALQFYDRLRHRLLRRTDAQPA